MKNNLFIFAATLILVFAFALPALADYTGPLSSPPICTAGSPGCAPPIDVSTQAQIKQGGLSVNGLFRSIRGLISNNNASVAISPSFPLGGIGATAYCDETGANCYTVSQLAGGQPPPPQQPWPGIDTAGCSSYTSTTGKVWWDGNKFVCGADVGGAQGDNLGDHIADKNIQLGSWWLSGDGNDEGVSVSTIGATTITGPVNVVAGSNTNSRSRLTSGEYCIGNSCLTSWPTGGGDHLGNHIAIKALKMGTQNIEFYNGSGQQYNWITQDTTANNALIIQSPKLRIKTGGSNGAIGSDGQVLKISGGNGDAVWGPVASVSSVTTPFFVAGGANVVQTTSMTGIWDICVLRTSEGTSSSRSPYCGVVGSGSNWKLEGRDADCSATCVKF